jgi:hypothetical protein
MPHVIVKLRAGRPEELKAELAARLARIVADVVRCLTLLRVIRRRLPSAAPPRGRRGNASAEHSEHTA